MIKAGFVAIVGSPNVGKSTLLNQLFKQQLSITTPKAQTTRDCIKGIYNEKEMQIIFLDTPGFHQARDQLNHYMNSQISWALASADVIIYIMDAQYRLAKKEIANIKKLQKYQSTPIIVMINKIDLVTEIQTKALILELEKLNMFEDILAVSLKSKVNTMSFCQMIRPFLQSNMRFYEEDTITDQSQAFYFQEIIRKQVMLATSQELPYSSMVVVKKITKKANLTIIKANIIVERSSQKAVIIGKNGQKIKRIGQQARLEIEKNYNQSVYLSLNVVVIKKWRYQKDQLEALGYTESEE